jgi:hypothetical protein
MLFRSPLTRRRDWRMQTSLLVRRRQDGSNVPGLTAHRRLTGVVIRQRLWVRGAQSRLSTATVRVPVDLSDHRKRLWDRAGEIVADPFQILYQKNYALCGSRLNLEFDLIHSLPIEHLFQYVAQLGVVRGDEPDCPGKRNLLIALIGL